MFQKLSAIGFRGFIGTFFNGIPKKKVPFGHRVVHQGKKEREMWIYNFYIE
jgi:hypothetical protein